MPSGLSGVSVVAAGWFHSLALRQDGTLIAWGYDYRAQATVPGLERGDRHRGRRRSQPGTQPEEPAVLVLGDDGYGQTTVPADLSGDEVVAVAAGASHSLALKQDGTVVGWGANYDSNSRYCGQATVPASLSGSVVTAIAAGAAITVWHSNRT